jgi:hypothetical protein
MRGKRDLCYRHCIEPTDEFQSLYCGVLYVFPTPEDQVKQGRTAQTLLRPGPDLSPLDWDKIRNFKTTNNNKSVNRMRFTIPSSDSDSDSEQEKEKEKEQRKDIKTANQKRSSWVTRSHSLSKPNTYTPKYSSNDSEGPYSTPAKPSKSFLSRSLNASSTGSNKKNHKIKLSR